MKEPITVLMCQECTNIKLIKPGEDPGICDCQNEPEGITDKL